MVEYLNGPSSSMWTQEFNHHFNHAWQIIQRLKINQESCKGHYAFDNMISCVKTSPNLRGILLSFPIITPKSFFFFISESCNTTYSCFCTVKVSINWLSLRPLSSLQPTNISENYPLSLSCIYIFLIKLSFWVTIIVCVSLDCTFTVQKESHLRILYITFTIQFSPPTFTNLASSQF